MKPVADAADFSAHLLARLGRAAAAPADIRQRIEARMPAAAGVFAPDSTDAVAELLGICSAEGWPVRAAGAGTSLRPDGRPAIVVSTCRLTAITEHEPADLVAGFQVGLTVSALGRALGAARQWLPLDPPDAGGATVGGALATAAAGPLRAGHGTPRDLALGLEVVTGDGRRLRFGGRVVKNVAGYDVVRLLIGSRGRLGVITHAYVRLRGRPRRDLTVVAPVARGADAATTAARLALQVRDQLSCDSLELLSPGAGPAGTVEESWTVAARFTGSESAVDAAVRTFRGIAAGARVLNDGAELWARLARREATGTPWDTRTSAPADLPDLMPAVVRAVDAGWVAAMHVTEGVIRMWRDTGPGGAATAAVPDLVASPLGPLFPAAVLTSPRLDQLTRRLCLAFDPAGILQASPET